MIRGCFSQYLKRLSLFWKLHAFQGKSNAMSVSRPIVWVPAGGQEHSGVLVFFPTERESAENAFVQPRQRCPLTYLKTLTVSFQQADHIVEK